MSLVCLLLQHRPHIPTGVRCFDPIICTRCGAVLDSDTGRWRRP